MFSSPVRSFAPVVGKAFPPRNRGDAHLVLRLSRPGGAFAARRRGGGGGYYPLFCLCTSYSSPSSSSSSSLPPPPPHFTTTTAPVTPSGATVVTTTTASAPAGSAGPVVKKRKRYRKAYPGESKGIVEEMRFVAMRLRNDGSKGLGVDNEGAWEDSGADTGEMSTAGEGETWKPSMEGFLKYLVDSKLIFETLERTVDRSDDVAYAFFRKTGLERSNCLSNDLDWFSGQGIVIPTPTSLGTTYAAYLNELAESSAPSFLCHFYNIYFAHATGGLAIGKQVSEKLLEDQDLEFYKWEEDVFELLQGTREKLNKLGEHWSRDEKNRCLREAAKCFRFLGQIVRLIIL